MNASKEMIINILNCKLQQVVGFKPLISAKEEYIKKLQDAITWVKEQ